MNISYTTESLRVQKNFVQFTTTYTLIEIYFQTFCWPYSKRERCFAICNLLTFGCKI